MVKLLINAGADPDIKNNKGHTSFDVAVLNNRVDIIVYLIEWSGCETTLNLSNCKKTISSQSN